MVYIAVTYLYTNCIHYTLCSLDTNRYDDQWYTLLLPTYILTVFIIPYVPLIHIVMMANGIHSCYLPVY